MYVTCYGISCSSLSIEIRVFIVVINDNSWVVVESPRQQSEVALKSSWTMNNLTE